MSDPILIVGSYAESEPIGGNRTLALQAFSLSRLGERIEVLTWPHNDTWRGARPDGASKLAGLPYVCVERANVPFHVVECPPIWAERSLTEMEWETAVAWAMRALEQLQPRLVHHQFWQNLWWFLEAAQRLGIPTVYSAHDYGMACLRTILVNGWDELCTVKASVDVCSRCIVAGRNPLGKANELVARLPFTRTLLAAAFGTDGKGPLGRAGGVRLPVRERVGLALTRCRRVLGKARAIIVASPFAREFFFSQFVEDADRIHVLPWFHGQSRVLETLPRGDGVLRLAIATRISPDKGMHVLLEGLSRVKSRRPVTLKIAGIYDSDYAADLVRRYRNRAGDHTVTWAGWQSNDSMYDFYSDVDAAVIPSLWYDNTPLALVEALAHGRPVVCTDVPSMTHLVHHEVNGLVFPMGDAGALARQIERLADTPGLVVRLARATRNVKDATEYAQELRAIYTGIVGVSAPAVAA